MTPPELAIWGGAITFGVVLFFVIVTELVRNPLPMGTRSLLYGSHTFWLHPIFVAVAWSKLYGFTVDHRIWVAFVVHDWGYWGKPNMDGREGIQHPVLGARLMGRLFPDKDDKWFWFTLLHSREMCREHVAAPSRLCMADKLSMTMVPAWLFVLLIKLSGEWREIVATPKYLAVEGFHSGRDLRAKHKAMQVALRKWVEDHIDEVYEANPFLPQPEVEALEVDEGGRPTKELTFTEVVLFCLGKPMSEADPQEVSEAIVRAHRLLSPDEESAEEEAQP